MFTPSQTLSPEIVKDTWIGHIHIKNSVTLLSDINNFVSDESKDIL